MKSPRNIRAVIALIVSVAALGVWNTNHRPTPGPKPDTREQSASSTPRYHPLARAGAGAATRAAEEMAQEDASPESRLNMFTDPEQAPGWSVAYGQEFWNRKPHSKVPVKSSAPLPEGVNIGDIVERVSHAFGTSETDPLPHVYAATYTARIDADGLSFSPHRVDVEPNAAPGTATASPDPATEAKFRTVAVSRGTDSLYAADESSSERAIIGNTAQALLHEDSGLVEHYEAAGSGVEVSWVLSQAPAGSGPLTVDAELSGLTYAGETENGHHYADANGIARVQVGHVTAIDARGTSWSVPMTAQGNRLTVTVPEEILATAEYPLAIDPAIGAEFGTDRRMNPPLADQQHAPALACNGKMFLLVWQDNRNAATAGWDIYGTRLKKDGSVMDPSGIAISTAASDQLNPAVGANGTNFLVAWQDNRNPAGNGDIYYTLVRPDRSLSAPGGLTISINTKQEEKPAVAGNGTDFLVAYTSHYNSTDIDVLAATVSGAGTVLNASLQPYFSGSVEENSDIASVGGDYLVVCEKVVGTARQIVSRLIHPNGSMNSIVTLCDQPGNHTAPSLAASANNYLVVWMDTRNSSSMAEDVYGALVADNGTAPNTIGFPVCATLLREGLPAVAFDGLDFVVVSLCYNSINTMRDNVLTRVNSAGIVLNAPGVHINGSTSRASNAAASMRDGKFLLVSDVPRAGRNKLIGTRLNAVAAQAAPVIQFATATMKVNENAGSVTIKIKCSGANAGAVSVRYTTMNGTAVAPTHYLAASGTLVFERGQTMKSITVPINDNLVSNPDRTFLMLLEGATGNAAIGLNSTVTVTIRDND